MGMRTVHDPYGSPAVLVDHTLGNSYDVVRKVATNIDFVKRVSTLFDVDGAVIANLHKRYSAIAGQTDFVLPVPVSSENDINVFVNNLWKSPVTSFVTNDNLLSFQNPLNEGDFVDVMIISDASIDAMEKIKEDSIIALEAIRNNTQDLFDATVLLNTSAQKWAENPEDVEVSEGKYSALHHSAKAREQRLLSEAALDSFDERYLGAKAVAPTVDNDGNVLLVGAVYWDTVSSQMFTWSGAEWRPTFLTGNAVRQLTTATGGQTAVTVPTYLVGANTIQVYLNGLKVMVGADYTETDQNTITFLSGLTAGDEVEVIVLQPYVIGTTGAESITTEYGVTLARLLELREGSVADLLADTTLNPAVVPVGSVIEAGGFRYEVAATGAADHHLTTAGGAKLYVLPVDNYLSFDAFGPAKDNITDDADVIEKALAAAHAQQAGLDWGSGDMRVSRSMSSPAATHMRWRYGKIKITLDPAATHQAHVLRVLVGGGLHHEGRGTAFEIDASQKANGGLFIYQQSGNQSDTLFFEGSVNRNTLNAITSSINGGMLVRGGFMEVVLDRPVAINCQMAVGFSVPGVVGVSGIDVTRGNIGAGESWPKRVFINDPYVDGVLSQDATDTGDMDGIKVLGDLDALGVEYSYAEVNRPMIKGTRGRALKFQTSDALVTDPNITHNSGPTGGFNGPSIDFQVGDGVVLRPKFTFDGANVSFTAAVGYNTSGFVAPTRSAMWDGGTIAVLNGASLDFAWSSNARANFHQHVIMRGARLTAGLVKRIGKVSNWSAGASVQISNSRFSRVSAAGVQVNGAGTLATVSVENTVNEFATLVPTTQQPDGAIVRLSEYNSVGFGPPSQRQGSEDVDAGLAPMPVFYAPEQTLSGTMRIRSAFLQDGENHEFEVFGFNLNVGLALLSANANQNSGALVGTGTFGLSALAVGSSWNLGQTADPGSGLFRAWMGTTGLVVQNNTGSARVITVMLFG